MIEVETQTTEVEVINNVEVTSTSQVEVETVDLGNLDITVAKKEYVITGDNIYIPMLYDDAPQWMKDLVQVVVDVSISSGNQSLINNMNAIIQDFAVSYVPLNQYTQSILDLGDEDSRINALITTLNSNFSDGLSSANSQIIEMQLTKASKDEVVAQVIQTIAAQLADGASNIGSTIGRIDQAIADETSARATSFQVLTSSLEDTNLDVTANATATSVLNTYVGLELGAPNGTGLLADVEILQKQNDGVIETTTGTYDVMISPENPDLAQLVVTAEPYVTWKASDVTGIDTRLAHIGDVYVKYADTANGAKEYVASYKFIRTVVDSTSPYATDSDGFTWALIVDQVAQDAYEQALNAYDLADNKRRVFTVTPSGPYDEGDLWVKVVSGSNQIWKCQVTREQLGYYNAADWSIASTDDTATVALQTGLADGTVTVKLTNAYVGTTPFLTYLTNEIDSKVGVYSGETAPVAGQPSGVAANDIYLWFTTASKVLANGTTQVYDITRTYKYSGSVWNEITTDSNITALADLADGKRTVFSGNTVPVGAVARDIWIPSATNGSYLQGEIYQYSGAAWVVATKYSADLEAVRSNLQSQVDGKVETYYQATVPTGMASVNNGDYWYCTADVSTYKKGKVYKYVHATTSWVETADVSRYAFDTADGKAAIFLSTSAPTTGYKINDMLIVIGSFNNGTTTFSDGVVLSSNASRVSGFTASDWVKKINDTEDLDAFVSVTYTPTVTSLQNQVDGKIESWYTASTSDPKSAWTDAQTRAKHDGDMWYQTNTKLSYYYSSTTNSWNLIDDAKAIQALVDAATAQATADGKISSYYLSTLAEAQSMSTAWSTTEKTNNVGDLVVVWNDTTLDNNGTWRWNGTSWVTTRDKKLVALASDVTALSTELDNGTNTWASADSTLENSLMTEISDEGARVESKFAYNSLLNINGIYKKSGFGLTTNYVSGSGTQIDPYVSEFWIDASRLKFTNSNVTGSVAPFTIDASGATPQITFNGKVTFSNVTNTTGTGSNLLYNSAPKIGSETKGWYVWTNSGMTVNLSAGFDIWKPTGGASVAANITGNPSIGSVYDVGQSSRFPVIAGSRYEASAYISAHRSNSYVYLIFYDTSGTAVGESQGNVINYAGSNALSNWGRSSVFTTAPGNAATAILTIRSIVTGNDPYCFVTNAFAGVAEANQTTPSNWSEGTSAGATYTSELSNDAGFTTLSAVNSSVNSSIYSNNDVFAQKLGYINYSSMVSAATAGNTIINGGYVNTSLLQANSINAGMINTVGLIAENISANEIVGKIITGAIINGAVVNGAVVKASYLDLDGELEVLTNYHITVAMYNANPSLYSDAVYLSATNEYRIPSLSTIREATISHQTSSIATYYGVMSSYNTANVGDNLKAVKIRPSFSNQVSFIMIDSTCSDNSFDSSFTYGIKNHFRLKLGTITLLECVVTLNSQGDYNGGNDTTTIQLSGNFFTPITHTVMSAYYNNDLNTVNTLNIGIGTLSVNTIVSQGSWSDDSGYSYPNKVQLICTLQSGTSVLPSDWTSGKLSFQQVVIPQSSPSAVHNGISSPINGLTKFNLNQSLYINNMV